MSFSATNDAAAGAIFQSTVQATGVDVSHLGQLAQVQLAVANALSGSIPDTVSTLTFTEKIIGTTALTTPSAYTATTGAFFASTVSGAVLMGYGTTGDVTLKNRAGTSVFWVDANASTVTAVAGVTVGDAITCSGSSANPAGTVRYIGGQATGTTNLDSNVPSGGTLRWRVAGSVMAALGANALSVGNAGAAFGMIGTTTALTADAASGALTISSMIGTGSGAVGGMIFRVPVTHGSDSVAQSLTTVLTLGATTQASATFAAPIQTSVAQLASVVTTPGTAGTVWTWGTGQGGNTTITTTGVGGKGADFALTTGAGGTAALATTAGTGGAGGDYSITTGAGAASAVTGAGTGTGGKGGAIAFLTGAGGATSTSTGVNLGGASGAITFTTAAGGAATNGSANTGGASGVITLATGNGGAGATAQGNSGSITLQTGSSTATVGTIVLKPGTLAVLTASWVSATVGLITIDGTYGAGVASLRLNGLTTAAVNNQTGTLTNAPSAGNPTFWAPISIDGNIRYVPCWS